MINSFIATFSFFFSFVLPLLPLPDHCFLGNHLRVSAAVVSLSIILFISLFFPSSTASKYRYHPIDVCVSAIPNDDRYLIHLINRTGGAPLSLCINNSTPFRIHCYDSRSSVSLPFICTVNRISISTFWPICASLRWNDPRFAAPSRHSALLSNQLLSPEDCLINVLDLEILFAFRVFPQRTRDKSHLNRMSIARYGKRRTQWPVPVHRFGPVKDAEWKKKRKRKKKKNRQKEQKDRTIKYACKVVSSTHTHGPHSRMHDDIRR